MFYSVIADGAFGSREATYKMVEGVFALRDEGDHDNLAGNDLCCDFEGLTKEQADQKADALNSEPVGHSYDGCHACTWSIKVRELDTEDVPAHLTYNEPSRGAAMTKRYTLLLSQSLFDEVERLAQDEGAITVEVMRRFIRLGLLATKIQREGGSLIIRKGDREQEIFII